MTEHRNNNIKIRGSALLLGFCINVIGNSLTMASNMGAEPWAAAAQNLYEASHTSVGIFLFIFGVANAIINQVMLKAVDWVRFVGEIIYIALFSYFVDLILGIMQSIGIGDLNIWIRGFLSCFGVAMFCVGISLYQRANILMHPNDDTSNLIRFKFLHGSAILSQLVDIVPAFFLIGLCWILDGKMVSVNVGTIFSLICNGILIKEADKQVWPKLRHNHRHHHKLSELFNSLD